MQEIIKISDIKRERSESHLVKKARAGNDRAFESLLMKYKIYMYKIAYTYVKNQEIALDIVQETTYKAWIKINTLKDDNSFKAWITKILVNTAINHIKKESKTVFLEDEECESIYESNGVSIEEKLDLYRAIDFVKPKYKTVIIFRYFDDMKIEDISYMLDIPINTVKSQLKRATQQLNNILKENYLNV